MTHEDILFKMERDLDEVFDEIKIYIDLLHEYKTTYIFQVSYMLCIYLLMAASC